MKRRKLILASCLIVIVLLTALYFALSRTDADEAFPVYVLMSDVEAGESVRLDLFKKVYVSEHMSFPNIKFNQDEINDKIFLNDLDEGEIISANDIGPVSEGLVYQNLEIGKELYSVSIKPENSNGWWLYEGNKIDIYVFLPDYYSDISQTDSFSEPLSDPIESVRIIEDIKINRIMNEVGGEISDKDKVTRILSLELDPEQIKLLIVAEKLGTIKLVAGN